MEGPSSSTQPDSQAVWRFVNISKPIEIRDLAFRQFVRSSVMRSHRRKQRLELVKKLKMNDGPLAEQHLVSSRNKEQSSSEQNIGQLFWFRY